MFLPEPGACAGRLDPDKDLVPDWLAPMLDWHVWPSASPDALSGRARTVCEHVDWELVWNTEPDLFARRAQVGAPPLVDLWTAKHVLADAGIALAFDVQLEVVDDELALAVYGAGVVGRLDDASWREVAHLLTTCCSTLREPREDVEPRRGLSLLRPARPATGAGRRPMPAPVQPESWQLGDWVHTWWTYPFYGTLRDGCQCAAHTAPSRIGPGTRASA
ncbi:hypothetical protein SUDANB95_08002 (plasmid) [Actinosynnema sp. ALI-1.44]